VGIRVDFVFAGLPAEHEAVGRAVERVFHGQTPRKLLQCLWENRAYGPGEHAIATEALGRKADFDPNMERRTVQQGLHRHGGLALPLRFRRTGPLALLLQQHLLDSIATAPYRPRERIRSLRSAATAGTSV
jgi:hypothetical protein